MPNQNEAEWEKILSNIIESIIDRGLEIDREGKTKIKDFICHLLAAKEDEIYELMKENQELRRNLNSQEQSIRKENRKNIINSIELNLAMMGSEANMSGCNLQAEVSYSAGYNQAIEDFKEVLSKY